MVNLFSFIVFVERIDMSFATKYDCFEPCDILNTPIVTRIPCNTTCYGNAAYVCVAFKSLQAQVVNSWFPCVAYYSHALRDCYSKCFHSKLCVTAAKKQTKKKLPPEFMLITVAL